MVKFSGLTICELINHNKVTFFSTRILPTSLAKWNMCLFLRFQVREGPEKYFLLSSWCRELYGPGPRFFSRETKEIEIQIYF